MRFRSKTINYETKNNWTSALVTYLNASEEAIKFECEPVKAINILRRTASDPTRLHIAEPFFESIRQNPKSSSETLKRIQSLELSLNSD